MRLAQATLVITATALLLIGLALLFWAAFDVILLLFAGVLAAVLLSGISGALARLTRLSYRWALALVLLAGTAGIIAVAWWLAPGIGDQVEELRRKLPESFDRLRTHLQHYGWANELLDSAPSQRELLGRQTDIFERVTGVFLVTLGVLTSLLIVLFLGLFLAVAPSQYRSGLLHLVPMKRRRRAEEVLDAVGNTLWWWLVAKIGSMMVVGVLTWLGLWALSIPLAFTLALLAAILTFIPNLGPLISALPAVLLGLQQGPSAALWVALLFYCNSDHRKLFNHSLVSAARPVSAAGACYRGADTYGNPWWGCRTYRGHTSYGAGLCPGEGALHQRPAR